MTIPAIEAMKKSLLMLMVVPWLVSLLNPWRYCAHGDQTLTIDCGGRSWRQWARIDLDRTAA